VPPVPWKNGRTDPLYSRDELRRDIGVVGGPAWARPGPTPTWTSFLLLDGVTRPTQKGANGCIGVGCDYQAVRIRWHFLRRVTSARRRGGASAGGDLSACWTHAGHTRLNWQPGNRGLRDRPQ